MMERPKIIRLFGKADSFDLEFSKIGGTTWTCEVPPDTDDGVYAVELTAINELGETAYWTGELYMCGGVCHFRIFEKPFVFWFAPLSALDFDVSEIVIYDFKTESELNFETASCEIFIEKECCHVR